MQEQDREALALLLGGWMAAQQKIASASREVLRDRALEILKQAEATGEVHVLTQGKGPIAVFLRMKPKVPRVHGERVLFYEFDPKMRSQAIPWVKRMLKRLGESAPRNTRVGIPAEDLAALHLVLWKAGFHTRYEILYGKTEKALQALIRKKDPPWDLEHLGLELRELGLRDVDAVLRLQKRVFRAAPQHGNFSHTERQLRQDRKSYRSAIRDKKGRLLGVFRRRELLGFMGAFIQGNQGGFTFCLHPSIQGMGVSKTGYLLLLNYLKKMKVPEFYGGTSQPAVKSLGKLMGRQLKHVLYVKAAWK